MIIYFDYLLYILFAHKFINLSVLFFLWFLSACDRYITDEGDSADLSSPGYPLAYQPDQACTYFISSVNDKCLSIFIISLDTEGPEEQPFGEDEECEGLDGLLVNNLSLICLQTAFL